MLFEELRVFVLENVPVGVRQEIDRQADIIRQKIKQL